MKKENDCEFKTYLDLITDSERKNYIENRVIKEIKWYNKKSIINQKCYKRLTVISLMISSSVPIITLMSNENNSANFKIIIAVLGALITAISALMALYNFKELWVQYRSNCENLKSRLHLYFTRSGEYKELNNEDAFKMLVVECEKQIKGENIIWKDLKSRNSSDKR